MSDILRALSLLTTLPIRPRREEGTSPGRAMAWYPLAGAAIGILLAAAAVGLAAAGALQRAPLLGSAIILAIWVVLTGALHLDGWADCCDALFVPVDRARRLEIMKDPRLGSFGAVGLVTLLLIKLGAISTLAGQLPVLLLVPVLARWVLVLGAAYFPLARKEGMAFYFRQSLGRREVLLATATALVITAACWRLAGPAMLVLPVAVFLAMIPVGVLATRRLGGLTGDVYGAIIEVAEVAALVAAAFTIRS